MRDRLLAASRARGCRGGAHDTRATLLELVRLRAERARLLGFANHAAAVTAGETAGTPEAVAALLAGLAAARDAERAARTRRARRAGRAPPARVTVAADWAFLAEQVRAERHDVDLAAMRPYFELDRVLVDGVFHAATLLYGVRFTARDDLVGYHPDTRVFEVVEEDGTPVGLYLLDPYARDSKRGGAWMSSLVSQSELAGDLPVVVNNLNVPKPAAGEPTLLTLDETETLFHEFGHALHGLFARVRYPSQAGTNVYRDFVELPSQVNELWMLRPEILASYAVHHETGERMPQELVDRAHRRARLQRGLRDRRVPRRGRARPGVAPHRPDERRDGRRGVRARGARRGRPRRPARAAALLEHVLRAHLRGRLRRRVLLVHLERGAGRRHHGVVRGARRCDARERRSLPREILAPGGSRDPGESVRALLGREPTIGPLLARRGLGERSIR